LSESTKKGHIKILTERIVLATEADKEENQTITTFFATTDN
jgi:hypothetical protein